MLFHAVSPKFGQSRLKTLGFKPWLGDQIEVEIVSSLHPAHIQARRSKHWTVKDKCFGYNSWNYQNARRFQTNVVVYMILQCHGYHNCSMVVLETSDMSIFYIGIQCNIVHLFFNSCGSTFWSNPSDNLNISIRQASTWPAKCPSRWSNLGPNHKHHGGIWLE